MLKDEPIFCPECGYNLRDIPEDRCPECGFGYEHAAIRSIAEDRALCRRRVYRRVLLVAGIGLACWFIPSGADTLDSWLFRAVLLAACLLIMPLRYRELRWHLEAAARYFEWPWKAYLFVAFLPPLLIVTGVFFPQAFRVAAIVLLLLAFVGLLREPSRFPHAELSLPEKVRRAIRRWRRAAWIGVCLALCLIALDLAF